MSKFKVFLSVVVVGILFLPVSEVFAYRMLYKSFVETESRATELVGVQKGEQFGASIASGDVNGDGTMDLIVGSPFYSSAGLTWNGKVSIFYGQGSFVENGVPDFVVYGRADGDQLGSSVASGDFNGDGMDDILIGAYNARSDETRPGRAFLVFGRSYRENNWISLTSTTADMEFVGESDGDSFGLSVHMADINQDDIVDILIGAPFAVSIGGVKSGAVYGYMGSTFSVDSVHGTKKFFGRKDCDVVFSGQEDGERFGSAIAVGDIVAGHFNDLVVSAYFADGENGSQTGKIYIFKGEKKYAKWEFTAQSMLVGENPYDWFGFSVDVANIDGQSKDDILVSNFPYLNGQKNGQVYALYGRTKFGDAENDLEFVVGEESADLYFEGRDGNNLMGADVALGDINGDGDNDFVIGAPGVGLPNSVEEGEVYLFYQNLIGDKTHFSVTDEEVTTFVFGARPDDWFGAKVDVLDFDGDGYEDVVVSSRYADLYDPNSGLISSANNGKVYILLGDDVPFGTSQTVRGPEDDYVTRGGLVSRVVESFQIEEKRQDFINNCYEHREFCFYAFTGVSTWDGVVLEPEIVLYPDVPFGSEYYESVTIATMLGMLSGYANESGTPFKPDEYITRIQAIKVILGVNQLVEPLYRFELVEQLGGARKVVEQFSYFKDVDSGVSAMWWYPRFANFAYENDLVKHKLFLRPDDYMTQGELDYLIEQTQKIVNVYNS